MSRPIFVGNFEYETRQCLFSKYGRVECVDMKSGFAFVYFEDDRDAADAIRGLDNSPFGYDRRKLLDRVISVEYALKDDGERDDRYDSPRRGYGRRGDSPYGRSPSPAYHRQPSPNYGPARSPAYNRYNSPTYDRRRSPGPAYDRQMSPDYGRHRSPKYGRYRSRSPVRRSRT